MRKNNLLLLFVNIILAAISISAYIIMPQDETSQMFQQVICLIITVSSFVQIKSICRTIINIHTIFLFFILFFGGTRVLLDLVGYGDMMERFWYTGNFIPFDVNLRSILNLSIAMCFYTIGVHLFFNKNHTIEITDNQQLHIPQQLIWLMLVVGFIVKIQYAINAFTTVILQGSYIEMHAGEVSVALPLYLRLLSELPMFSLFVGLSTMKRGKNYMLYIILFVIYAALDMATGQRGFTILSFTMMYYYLMRKGMIKFSLVKICGISAVFIVIFMYIGDIRNGITTEDNDYLSFIWKQGVSFGVLQQTINMRDQLDYNFYNLIDNIIYPFRHYFISEQTLSLEKEVLRVSTFKMWSSYISYMSNPRMYATGYGMGGNYIAQLFAIGGEIGVALGSMFIAKLTTFFDFKLSSTNLFTAFFAFICLRSIIYIPRDNMFDFLSDAIYCCFIPWIIYAIFKGKSKTSNY